MPETTPTTRRRALFIDDDLWARAKAYADSHGESVATIIRMALREFLSARTKDDAR